MSKKIRYCPRCKSVNVKIDITPGAAIGAPQKWKCMKCWFDSYMPFPQTDLKEQLEKQKIQESKNGRKE
jgi:transposase-like protein